MREEEHPSGEQSQGTGNGSTEMGVQGKTRKMVSYRDKVLCLNGEDNVSESEDEDWAMIQRREEEEEDIPDGTPLPAVEDPLCPTYIFSKKQHKEDCVQWRKALIVKLMGKKIATRFLMPRLQRLWNLIGKYKLIELDNGFILLKFEDEMDYLHVLQEGPWIVSDHYVIVQRWRPFFDPYNEKVRKLAIWIRILGMPMEFYTMQHLWRIGNMFGKTLKVDPASFKRREETVGDNTKKGRFARICVEVDLRRSFVSKLRLWDYIQEEEVILNIGYEGLHLICFACRRYGHRKDDCDGGMDFWMEKKDTSAQADEAAMEKVEQNDMQMEKKKEEGEAFGAWMVVKRNRKGRNPRSSTAATGRLKPEEQQGKGGSLVNVDKTKGDSGTIKHVG